MVILSCLADKESIQGRINFSSKYSNISVQLPGRDPATLCPGWLTGTFLSMCEWRTSNSQLLMKYLFFLWNQREQWQLWSRHCQIQSCSNSNCHTCYVRNNSQIHITQKKSVPIPTSSVPAAEGTMWEQWALEGKWGWGFSLQEPKSQFEKQHKQGWWLMQKPKEMAERVFVLLLGFACFLLKFGWFPPPVRKALTSSTRTVNATSHSYSFWMRSIICFTCRSKGQGSTRAYRFSSLLKAQISIPAVQFLTCTRVDLLSNHSTALYFAKGVDTFLSEVTRGINRSFLRLSIFVGGN